MLCRGPAGAVPVSQAARLCAVPPGRAGTSPRRPLRECPALGGCAGGRRKVAVARGKRGTAPAPWRQSRAPAVPSNSQWPAASSSACVCCELEPRGVHARKCPPSSLKVGMTSPQRVPVTCYTPQSQHRIEQGERGSDGETPVACRTRVRSTRRLGASAHSARDTHGAGAQDGLLTKCATLLASGQRCPSLLAPRSTR